MSEDAVKDEPQDTQDKGKPESSRTKPGIISVPRCESVRSYSCEHCDMSFTKGCHLKEHVKRVHLKLRDMCDLCGKPFANINQHMRVIHKELKSGILAKEKCQECGREFYDLSKHMARAHSLKIVHHHECSLCQEKKTFSSKFSLDRHMQRTHGENQSCEQCGKVVANMQVHVKKVHKTQVSREKNIVDVNIEDKSLDTLLSNFSENTIDSGTVSLLKQLTPVGSVRVNDSQNYILELEKDNLEECEDYFFQESPLECSNEEPVVRLKIKTIFKCTLCKYSTDKSSNYSSHYKLVHLKSKTLCQSCGKEYSNINQHMRIVHKQLRSGTLEKSECPHCGQGFFDLDKHIRHGRAHTEHWTPKSLVCNVCGEQFSKHCNMVRHQERVHQAIKHTCSVCHKQVSGLSDHMRLHRRQDDIIVKQS